MTEKIFTLIVQLFQTPTSFVIALTLFVVVCWLVSCGIHLSVINGKMVLDIRPRKKRGKKKKNN